MSLIKPPLFTIMVETTHISPWLVCGHNTKGDLIHWAPTTITVGISHIAAGMMWPTSERATDFMENSTLDGNFEIREIPTDSHLRDFMHFYRSNNIECLMYDPSPDGGSAVVLKIDKDM